MREGLGDLLGFSVLFPSFVAVVEGEGLLFLRSTPLTIYFLKFFIFGVFSDSLCYLASKGPSSSSLSFFPFTSRGYSTCCIPPISECCCPLNCHIWACILSKPFLLSFEETFAQIYLVSDLSLFPTQSRAISFCGGIQVDVTCVLPPLKPHSSLLLSSSQFPYDYQE